MTLTPPPDATIPERAVTAPKPGEQIPAHYRMCFGCGTEHAAGLRLERVAAGDMRVTANFHIQSSHQGAPGLAHGGLISTALDETFGALNYLLGAPAVTAKLEVDFHQPVPVGSTLQIDAWITGVVRRKVFVEARGTILEGSEHGAGDTPHDAKPAVTARGLFIQVPVEHFLNHGDAGEVQRIVAESADKWPHTHIEVNP